ncbi:MAG: hypothetical protein ABFD08_11225 [Syntrophomonas sp.]
MDKPATRGIPKFIPFLIVILLGSMYYYAMFMDTSKPEIIVQRFYQAYFQRDFPKVSENLSVFWSVRFLPQYSLLPPSELVAKRAAIEADATKVIAQIESKNEIPKNIKIEVMPDYTKTGEYSALVVYNFVQNGKPSGMELAVLIKENGRFRIFNMSPVATQDLEQIKNGDLKELDEGFKSLLGV